MHRTLTRFAIGAAILLGLLAGSPVLAQDADTWDRFVGAAPEAFADPAAAADALESRLAADDKAGVAKLLGLDPEATVASDDFDDSFAAVKEVAAGGIRLEDAAPDRRLLVMGAEAWPFPFPLVSDDGRWSFDTVAGIEEVINRRIGENELQAIATARAYVEVQEDYRTEDWDDDGVYEYAQNLIAEDGTYNGLYWPPADNVPDSPAGPYVEEAGLEPDPDRPSGYFGYRFRILKGQGDNVAGDAYDYVVNGNMIGGFALIAWPAIYDETGIKTFLVSHYGTVYEKDLGSDTATLVEGITTFDPDDTWTVVTEEGD